MELVKDELGRKVLAFSTTNESFREGYFKIRKSDVEIFRLMRNNNLNLNELKNNYLYNQIVNNEFGLNNINFNKQIYNPNYITVLGSDISFIDSKQFKVNDEYDKYCLYVTDDQNNYYGYVWVFILNNKPYIGMLGIRSTIIRSLFKIVPPKYKGIADLLLPSVKIMANYLNPKIDTIIVPHPLESMKYILNKHGFTEHYDDNNILQFIKPIISTDMYFKLKFK